MPEEHKLDSMAAKNGALGTPQTTAVETIKPKKALSKPKTAPKLIIGKAAEHDPNQIGPKEQIIGLKDVGKRGGALGVTIGPRPMAHRTKNRSGVTSGMGGRHGSRSSSGSY